MKSLLVWIITALVFAAVGGLCIYGVMHGKVKELKEKLKQLEEPTASAPAEGKEEEKKQEPAVSHDEQGHVVVTVNKEGQERLGIEVKAIEAASHRPDQIAFGTLAEDPTRTFTVRAPMAGIVKSVAGLDWPKLGGAVADGATIGAIIPRLGPAEQADIAARLAATRADEQVAKATLEALQVKLESKKKLNADGKIASDQEVQEAGAQVKAEEAKLHGAQDIARVLGSFMSATARPGDAIPMAAQTGGHVIEILAQPGEAVESGQAVLKIGRFDRLIARLSLPAGESAGPDVTHAQVIVPGHDDKPLAAERLPIAPAADSVTGGQTLFFTVASQDLALQPGLAVVGRLELPGEPKSGVAILRSAVVRVSGQGWVYVRGEEEKFTRRLVPLDVSMVQGWFVAEGFKPGDEVVVRGAQAILSEELKFGVQEEEE